MAAVAFAYGVWENFVEQLAMEVVGHLSDELNPADVPDAARSDFTKGRDAWDISVHPGWRLLWQARVRDKALGDDAGARYGLNTAGEGQVRELFRIVGVDPFEGVGLQLIGALPEFVALRGEIVHTSKVPDGLRKADALEWGDFVAAIVGDVDQSCRLQCRALLALS